MLNDHLVRPQYEGNCFANLPDTVRYLLGAQHTRPLLDTALGDLARRYDTVVLILADALGWRFIQEVQQRSVLLRTWATNGAINKLTAQFPSTTAAHVTCIHTGLPVGQSGVYEWQYYEPSLDALIAPLLYSYAGTMKRETLAPDADPHILYPRHTLYQDLLAQGIDSHVFQYRGYTPSTFSDAVFAGAQVHPYLTLPQALASLRQQLQQQDRPSYYFLYFAGVDTVCHEFGPCSPQVAAEVDAFLLTLDQLLLQKLAGEASNTLLMLTADHGQVEVDPRRTVYLNLDPRFAGIERFIKQNRRGELLVPAGSPRDLFLYIYEDALAEAQAWLADRLAGVADVVTTRELIEAGFFGPGPLSPAFLSRVGNLVILPAANESVWWYVENSFEMKFYGHHGGLTPAEMEIPLLLYRF